MQILKVSITICQLPWWTRWLEEQHEPYMENTSKEFFAPTLMSGLSQSSDFGRAHMFPLFQPAIQALTSKQPCNICKCNICKVFLASQMRKKHPSLQESVFTDGRDGLHHLQVPFRLEYSSSSHPWPATFGINKWLCWLLGKKSCQTYWILNKMVLVQSLYLTVAEEPPAAPATNISMAGSLCKIEIIKKNQSLGTDTLVASWVYVFQAKPLRRLYWTGHFAPTSRGLSFFLMISVKSKKFLQKLREVRDWTDTWNCCL